MSEPAIEDELGSTALAVNGEDSMMDNEGEENNSSTCKESEEETPKSSLDSSVLQDKEHDKEAAQDNVEEVDTVSSSTDHTHSTVVPPRVPPTNSPPKSPSRSPHSSSSNCSNVSPVLVHDHPLLEQTDEDDSTLIDTPPVSPPAVTTASGLTSTQTNEGVFFSGINYLGSSTVDAPVSETEANRKMNILKTQAGEPVPIILHIPPDNTGNIMLKDPANSNQVLTAFSIRHVLFCARGDTATEISDCLALNVIHKKSGVYHCHVFQCQISDAVSGSSTIIVYSLLTIFSVKESFMLLAKHLNKRYV